jgi:hypothetical protein
VSAARVDPGRDEQRNEAGRVPALRGRVDEHAAAAGRSHDAMRSRTHPGAVRRLLVSDGSSVAMAGEAAAR